MDFSLTYSEEQEQFAGEVRKWLDENVPEDLLNPRDILKMSREQWQKRRFLSPILRGEAATDEANQQTRALRHEGEGEYFIVNGQKVFVGGLYAPPRQFLLLTHSDLEAPRHQNSSSFIIPANLPGITIQPLDLFPLSTFAAASGPSGANVEAVKNSVFFDDVIVHESCLIGEEGDGWKVTQATFAVEHVGSARAFRNYIAEKFFARCCRNPKIIKRLKENPHLVDNLVNA